MDRIQVDYDALENVAREFNQEADGIDALIHRVRAAAEELECGGWTGLGANAFFNEMHDLVLPGLERLARALCEASLLIGQISTVIRQAEEEGARLFTQRAGLTGLAVLRGTETELDPLEQLGRWMWTGNQDTPTDYMNGALPRAVEHMQNTAAGQGLIGAATAAGIYFVMPDGSTLGDTSGVPVQVQINDQLDYAGGFFDAGSSSPTDDVVYMSAHPDKFDYGDANVAGTLSHEMQHAVDQHTGRLNTRGYDPTSTDIPTLETDIKDMVMIRVESEVRAHGVGYAVRDGGAYFDDGVLDAQETRYILETRGYADAYENEINEAFAAAYAADPSGGLRMVSIELDPYGNVEVLVLTLEEPTR